MDKELDLLQQILNERLDYSNFEELLRHHACGDDPYVHLGILLHRLTALLHVANASAQSLSLDELLPRIIDIILEALGADRATLFLYDSNSRELYSRIVVGKGINEIRFPSHMGIAGNVFTHGKAEIIPDAYDDERFNQAFDKQTGYRTKNILCVPVTNQGGDIIGVTQVLNKLNGPFRLEDQTLLDLMTTQASAALQNAQLYEQVKRTQEEEAQLLELTTAISSELHLTPLLQKIMAQTTNMLNADRSTLFMHDAKTAELWSQVAEGIGTKEIRFPCHLGIAGTVFTSGETINIPEAYEDSRFNQAIDKATGYRTKTILCMPVISRSGATIGVIQVLNKTGGPFNNNDERRLRSFAAQASVAIENAKLFDEVTEIKNYNESILQSMSNGVITLDAERKVTKYNQAILNILKLEEDGLLERPLEELIDERDDWMLRALERTEESGKTDLHMDSDIHLHNGERISINLTVVPLLSVKDTLIGSMLVVEDITEEKRIKGTMSRYMSKEVAEALISQGEEMMLGGKMQTATVLFSDIRSFTAISERIGALETVDMLNNYFSVMVEILFRHGGILDKYIGDAIMAVFGAPLIGPRDADNAVNAAVEMLVGLEEFNRTRLARGQEPIHIGLGLNTDDILAGNIGSNKRMDYTVIGDGVNLASRLEGANKYYGTKLLVSEFTVDCLQDDYLKREVELMVVKGKEKPVPVYEFMGYIDQERFPNLVESVRCYDEGLALYRGRQWEQAVEAFETALRHYDDDRVSRIYIDRCYALLSNPPGDDWSPVHRMTSK